MQSSKIQAVKMKAKIIKEMTPLIILRNPTIFSKNRSASEKISNLDIAPSFSYHSFKNCAVVSMTVVNEEVKDVVARWSFSRNLTSLSKGY